MEKRIAILVDGGFYQKRIHDLKDFDTPKRSVDFLLNIVNVIFEQKNMIVFLHIGFFTTIAHLVRKKYIIH